MYTYTHLCIYTHLYMYTYTYTHSSNCLLGPIGGSAAVGTPALSFDLFCTLSYIIIIIIIISSSSSSSCMLY